MAAALLWLALLASQPKVDNYTLALFEGSFVVRHGSEVSRVPVKLPEEKPLLVVLYRRDKNFAVWDERGLTIRAGKVAHSYRLPEISVTPKLFSKEEIQKTIDLIHKGMRHKEADSLSGSRRLGKNVYFLARWTDPDRKPWLEALVQVDLSQRHPIPVLLGRFEGFTTADTRISDKMFVANGHLCAATRREHDWGVASYSPEGTEFMFRSVGDDLVSVLPSGLYLEKTTYGTTVGGRLDLRSDVPSPLFEDRKASGWLDSEFPPLAVSRSPQGRVLRDCDTGAELPVSVAAQARRCGKLLLVWSPADAPKHAYLYDPERWARLAAWKAGG